ncbi:Vegetative protein 296 [archaeon HR06]|nr:Vegetative protein 296 [archaeon HR06]
MSVTLEIKDLHASVEGKEILKGVNLKVAQGEIHALMGPNGSGKSTLAYVIMGHPRYKVTSGDILLNGESILNLSADERAKRGLFLAFQYPVSISGVTIFNFLRASVNAVKGGGKPIPIIQFRKMLRDAFKSLGMDEDFSSRYLNEGFSGGEKKRAEIVQLTILRPKIAILDETDSGLDIDALKIVAEGVNKLYGPEMGILLITHYQRILKYIRPQYVHVMIDGKIVSSGGEDLAEELEKYGYSHFTPKS